MLTIRADGETGDIVWNGYLPDVIDELATANVAVIKIVADSIKKGRCGSNTNIVEVFAERV